uniref:Uncharacterized protein n=1 Tax=Romanomermis culicivorax TaxID=13658 RepID=A0A915KJ20_ROMCU
MFFFHRQICHTNSSNVDFNAMNMASNAELKNPSGSKEFHQLKCLEWKKHKKGEELIMPLCHSSYNKDQLNVVEKMTTSM